MAVGFVLETLGAAKDIGPTGINMIDVEKPEDFSYSEALIEALENGLKNPVEIADFIFKKRKSRL